MEVDYKKMVEQDDELKSFLRDVLLEIHLSTKDGDHLVKALYGFYQIGMSRHDVVQWYKNMISMNRDES